MLLSGHVAKPSKKRRRCAEQSQFVEGVDVRAR
jgi:hypothetical protein